jgi:hypothetical protein
VRFTLLLEPAFSPRFTVFERRFVGKQQINGIFQIAAHLAHKRCQRSCCGVFYFLLL